MAANKQVHRSVAEYVAESKLITVEQLQQAMEEQVNSGENLSAILIKRGYIDENILVKELSRRLKIPLVDLKTYNFDLEVVNIISEHIARKHNVIALSRLDKVLTVAVNDPTDVLVIDELHAITKYDITPMFAIKKEIEEAISRFYNQQGSPAIPNAEGDMAEAISAAAGFQAEGSFEDVDELKRAADSTSVIRILDSIIKDAVRKNASDIHIEPDEKRLFIRIRIDGVLYETTKLPKDAQPPIISRIKVLADMDIAERRLPQDGRIGMKVQNKDIELRISTFPTIYGENVVMRILDKSTALLGLEKLGFNENNLIMFREAIKRPYGIILVTGPTGSGKTTTLYAALNEINSAQKNILTLEEPVEYKISGIRQTQVNPKAGLTFASGLRHMLRQDPDIMMIGEIRDMETAEMAIRSALTGHLVFSTLHTNDAIGALTRLVDMGVEPFLISSSIVAVMAQRLVRTLCPNCKVAYKPDEALLKRLNLSGESKDYDFFREGKCKECFNIGSKGRTGMFELLVVTEELQKLVVEKASNVQLKETAMRGGLKTLRQDGVNKIIKGVVSVSEAMQVI